MTNTDKQIAKLFYIQLLVTVISMTIWLTAFIVIITAIRSGQPIYILLAVLCELVASHFEKPVNASIAYKIKELKKHDE